MPSHEGSGKGLAVDTTSHMSKVSNSRDDQSPTGVKSGLAGIYDQNVYRTRS